ncbi:UNVERIFIED_CONTAM: hypothetical protein PYX00_004816 [Menopon gallinae]|uniref:Uncharacterized protein n=1 Tax=Menopon gallinae TaxID=328185 RepID=A0AAW2I5X1_9NEOP
MIMDIWLCAIKNTSLYRRNIHGSTVGHITPGEADHEREEWTRNAVSETCQDQNDNFFPAPGEKDGIQFFIRIKRQQWRRQWQRQGDFRCI